MTRGDPVGASGLEELYPFLYSGASDVEAVLTQVRQSTVDKTREIIELRASVLESDGERLYACARDLARAAGCWRSATAAAPPTRRTSPACSSPRPGTRGHCPRSA